MKFEQPNLEKPHIVPKKEKEVEKISKEIFEKITKHSQEFDKEIAENSLFSKEEIEKNWRMEKWQIGETEIKAVGLMHVPETFLYKREEIEKIIQESDIVVSEFTPEALGMYDKTQDKHLKNIKSRFNEHYDLAELRKTYLKHERAINIGIFHHEIELLAAKHGKDLACFDLQWSKKPEEILQDYFFYTWAAEQLKETRARAQRIGLYGGAIGLGLGGLTSLLKELKLNKPISRRTFLKMALIGGAGLIAGITPEITKTPPKKALETSLKETEKTLKKDKVSEETLFETLRDVQAAESLSKLSKLGYKKIALVYGIKHLTPTKDYLYDLETRKNILSNPKNQQLIKKYNPDSFKIFRLSPGKNHSEKFVASKDLVWKRIK